MGSEELTGGNVNVGLVRIGRTVRRPAGPQTSAVHALLTHLADVGFRNAPRSHGLDDAGRHVVEYVPGPMAHPTGPDVPPVDAGARGPSDSCGTRDPCGDPPATSHPQVTCSARWVA